MLIIKIINMSLKERLEILDLINSIQNKRNEFINISVDDLEMVYNYIVEHDLDNNQVIDLLKDLAFI